MRWTGLTVLLLYAMGAMSDSITIDGERLEDVYIRETNDHYYVQLPNEGRVRVVGREEVEPDAVWINPDDSVRQSLHRQWSRANAALREQAEPLDMPSPSGQRADPPAPSTDTASSGRMRISAPSNPSDDESYGALHGIVIDPAARQYVTDGLVSAIRLRDIPLRDALNALLRPLGLDYRIEGNILFISTPQRLRTEAFTERIETRIYELEGAPAAETLPKIVLQNP